ncbi:M23 family metallopeptidase [Photobacterium atrarenae]|uniref:M23 family metallopeptidase n=1 Tax=Photobacterium atrarenae TaxID=865757 RepID=A0ABY5GDB4_9GAMM|nr:peptidoglycan DD-metalloendopeptidase family protein [Photobacterium atrarenae]UTV27230.1 M23 family metallopeptidase [Photobacterium atrarenae]
MSDNHRTSTPTQRVTARDWLSHYNKRNLILIASTFLIMLAAGSYSVYQLYLQNQTASQQLNQLNSRTQALIASLSEESAANQSLTEELAAKNTALKTLTQRIDDVETILGLQSGDGEEIPLAQRVNSAAVSSAVRGTLFRLLPNGSPTPGIRMSSGFGTRVHPVTGKRRRHRGLDFAANTGTPIYAPADGVIEAVRPSKKGSGNFIKLNHSLGFATTYSHLSRFNVKRGQFVRKGDLIGWSGNTGLSTGPHLHYEIRFLGRALNPRPFVEWTPESFDTLFEKEKTVQWASLLEMVNTIVSMQVQLTQAPLPAQPLTTASNQASSEAPTGQAAPASTATTVQ